MKTAPTISLLVRMLPLFVFSDSRSSGVCFALWLLLLGPVCSWRNLRSAAAGCGEMEPGPWIVRGQPFRVVQG